MLRLDDVVNICILQVCAAQAISGTGSIRLGMEFLKKFHSSEVVYVSKPTWGKSGADPRFFLGGVHIGFFAQYQLY